MPKHQFKPVWRRAEQLIDIYENRDLQKYFESDVKVVRFCVSDTGRLVSGDAMSVLHVDILQVALKLGDYNVLVAGVAVLCDDGWHVWLQPIGTKNPTVLLLRLITWLAFVEGVTVIFESGWNSDL